MEKKKGKVDENLGGKTLCKSQAIRLVAFSTDCGLSNKAIKERLESEYGLNVNANLINNVLGPESKRRKEGSVLVQLKKLIKEVLSIAGEESGRNLILKELGVTNGNR